MSKKHKKKIKKYPLIILFFIVAILVAAFLSFKYVDFGKLFGINPGDEADTSQDKPRENVDTPTQNPASQIPTTNPNPTPIPNPSPEPNQFEGGNPNQNTAITGAITYVGVNDKELVIRVNIDQYLNGGTCNLVLSRGGVDIYGKEAKIIDSASTSTCEGFNVPLKELSSGNYQIRINLSSERKTGLITGEASI